MIPKTDNTVLSNGIVKDGVFFPKRNLPSGTLRVVLTTNCNFRCRYCFAEGEHDKSSRVLDIEDLKRVIKVSKEFGINSIKLTGGEPLLYPDMEELLEYIEKEGIEYIDLTTNISLLDKQNIELLNRYHVSSLTLSVNTLDANRFRKLSLFQDAELVYFNLCNVIEQFNGNLRINCVIFDEDFSFENYDEVFNFSKYHNMGLRFIEPSKVEGLPITYTKNGFKQYIDYLKNKASNVIQSDCCSVEYLFFEDWYLTVMHSLCDNRYCNSCINYMYIRVTSDLKLKPCLSRRDTEVEIDINSDNQIRQAFIEAVSYMGLGL